MCDCIFFLEAIQKGGHDLEKVLLRITKGDDPCGFKNVAYYVHRNYCGRCKHTYTWEDLLYEALMRFIIAIRRGSMPKKPDCRPLFFQIAKNTCWEWGRQENKGEPKAEMEEGMDDTENQAPKNDAKNETSTRNSLPIEDLKILMELIPELKEATSSCLGSMGRKCNLLLRARFFDENPILDEAELSGVLSTAGFQVSPAVIKAEISNCKARLRECLKNKLQDYYDDYITL